VWAQHAIFLETISREREIVCVCAKIKPTKVRTTTVGGQESAAKWKQKNELITLQWTQSLVENVRTLSFTHTHAHHTPQHAPHQHAFSHTCVCVIQITTRCTRQRTDKECAESALPRLRVARREAGWGGQKY